MRLGLAALALTASASCTKKNPTFCDSADACEVGQECDLAVNRCVEVVDPPDAAPRADGAPLSEDAGPDASSPPDAAPLADAAPAACESSTHTCIEAPPAPWIGPVIRFEADSDTVPPACTAAYPSRIDDFDFDLAAAGGCACDCDPATDLSCNTAVIVEHAAGLICSTFDPDTQSIANGACATLAGNMQGPRYGFAEPGITGGVCEPVLIDTLETAAFETSSRVCSGAVLGTGACGDGDVCAPVADEPYQGKQCIFLDGENACPVGSAYSERFVRYRGLSDTRACGGCTCGDPVGTCGGQLHFTDTCGTFPLLIGSVNVGSCSGDLTAASHVSYAGAPSGTCSASPGTTTGAAAETDPVTLCCLP